MIRKKSFRLSPSIKAHCRIRTNNDLPISIIYLCAFPNSEALILVFHYCKIGYPTHNTSTSIRPEVFLKKVFKPAT